jgi:hypothetical protein
VAVLECTIPYFLLSCLFKKSKPVIGLLSNNRANGVGKDLLAYHRSIFIISSSGSLGA